MTLRFVKMQLLCRDYHIETYTLSRKTLFIESWCDDERIIEENVRRVKISSPDVSRISSWFDAHYT